MVHVDKTVDNVDNFRLIHIKKWIFRITVLILVIICGSLAYCVADEGFGESYGESYDESYEESYDESYGGLRSDIVRFHVKANSNSEEDQALKLKVRNEVVSRLQSELEEVVYLKHLKDSYDMEERAAVIKDYVRDNLDSIEDWAEAVVEEEGYVYDVSAAYDIRWIPEKTYDDMVFPAGNYEALTLEIGSGQGDNWWCVIFPPLCLVGEDDGLVSGNKVILKSKIMEMLRKR